MAHPRRSRLRAWLETGGSERVTAHVEHCDRCARVLEEMAVEQEPELTGDGGIVAGGIGEALRAATEPPDGLNERVMQRIADRRLAEREASLFLGLFSIPRDAVELMMRPEEREHRSNRAPIEPDNESKREELE